MKPPRPLAALALLALLAGPAAAQHQRVQDDWSGGPGQPGPVVDWTDAFDDAIEVSWRALPGQLALAAAPLASPMQTPIDLETSNARGLAAGDLDGDGDDDVLCCGFNRILWWERQAGGGFVEHPISGTFEGPYALRPVDLDLDGDLDVAVAAFYGGPGLGENGRYAWLENLAGDGLSWSEHLVAQGTWGAESLDLADLDGDGDLDIAGITSLADSLGSNVPDVSWYENLDGFGGAWATHGIDTDFGGAIAVRAGDLDGDGDVDLAVSAYGADQVAWYENVMGDGSRFERHVIIDLLPTATDVDLADFDDDGDLDVLATGINAHLIAWFDNLAGDGSTWGLHVVTSPFVRSERCRAADLDGDGDVDVLGSSDQLPDFNEVAWFENLDGKGLVWASHPLDDFIDSVGSILAADVDDDGKLDVVTAYDIQRDIQWFTITGFQPMGRLRSAFATRARATRWGPLDWKAELPAGAALQMEARTADDPGRPGPWVVVPKPGADLGGLLDAQAPYLQLRLTLQGDGPTVSPVVHRLAATLIPDVQLADPQVGNAGKP